jgi:hypothetical protein
VPSTDRLISRPDPAVLGLRVAVGDPALDEPAGETTVPAFRRFALLGWLDDGVDDARPRARAPTKVAALLVLSGCRYGRPAQGSPAGGSGRHRRPSGATARLLTTAVDYDASCEPNSRRHHRLNLVVLSGTGLPASYS